MPRRSKVIPNQDEDSSSEEIDDVSEEVIYFHPKSPLKTPSSSTIPWVDKYAPGRTQDVSINPKKLSQVRDMLSGMLQPSSKCRILILSGPAGSSKSTVVKCIAEELYGPQNGGSGIRPLSLIEYFDSAVDDVYQPDHFRDFMEGCRYRSGQNSSVILIEELPNVFHDETLQSFRNCLRDWAYSSPELNLPPVVICLTEVDLPSDRGDRGYFTIDNYLTVETLLGRDILNAGVSAGLIQRVKFLPIAKTFIKRTLHNILSSEKIRLPKFGPADDFMQSLYDSGDIRASICNLEFWISSGIRSNGFLRESQISLFYAVGKVIHSSSKPRTKGDRDDSDSDFQAVSDVMDQYNNMGLLQLGLLENYQIYNGSQFDVEIAANIVDSLSTTDSLPSLGYEEYSLKAIRYELSKVSVTNRTLPMKFPRHFKCLKEQNKVRKEVSAYGTYIAQNSVMFNDINLEDGYFVPMIKNSFKYRLKHGRKQYLYNRVGGRFKKIYADEDLPLMEKEEEASVGEKDQFQVDILEKINEEANSKNGSDDGVSEDIDDGLSEDIEDSDATASDDMLDDTLNEELLSMVSQATKRSLDSGLQSESRKGSIQSDPNYDEGFSDDPELYMLVSQGKL